MIGKGLNNIYRISELVGGGGFADVYLGRDLRTNTVVAIKVLHAHYARDPQIIQRFLQEARTAQALVEPHIVRVLDAGEDSGAYYIVMEYVHGHTLAHLLQTRGSLPIQEAVEYTRQILQALEAAHKAGVVHRDIKPQNIMVTPDRTVKVMDFGIAKHAAAGKMTQTGMYLGTPQYMSPEQARGERVDRRSDLYSVAIVLYEMLGGRPPFDAESPWQVLRMQTDLEAPLVSQLRADVPATIVQLIARGLEKAPERRFQNAEEMLVALDTVAPHGGTKRNSGHHLAHGRKLTGQSAKSVMAPALAVGVALMTLVAMLMISGAMSQPASTPSITTGMSAIEMPRTQLAQSLSSPTVAPAATIASDVPREMITPVASATPQIVADLNQHCEPDPTFEKPGVEFGLSKIETVPGYRRTDNLVYVSALIRNNCPVPLTPMLSVTVLDPNGNPVTRTADQTLERLAPKEIRAFVQYVEMERTGLPLNLSPDNRVIVAVQPLTERKGEAQLDQNWARATPGTPTPIGVANNPKATLQTPMPNAASPSLRAAIERVKRAGYSVYDAGTYNEAARLRVLVGVKTSSADGYDQHVFFFLRDEYLGTDTLNPSAGVRVSWQKEDTVAVYYTLYRPSDPMCCPTGGLALVRFFWNGERLMPLDAIPSDDWKALLSRR